MASNNAATTPYNLQDNDPYYVEDGVLAPASLYDKNTPNYQAQRSRKRGGGCCSPCVMIMFCICCIVPLALIGLGYYVVTQKLGESGFDWTELLNGGGDGDGGDWSQYLNAGGDGDGDGDGGGGWSQYLNDMDDQTISNYIEQYTNNVDDDTIAGYVSNWYGNDGDDYGGEEADGGEEEANDDGGVEEANDDGAAEEANDDGGVEAANDDGAAEAANDDGAAEEEANGDGEAEAANDDGWE